MFLKIYLFKFQVLGFCLGFFSYRETGAGAAAGSSGRLRCHLSRRAGCHLRRRSHRCSLVTFENPSTSLPKGKGREDKPETSWTPADHLACSLMIVSETIAIVALGLSCSKSTTTELTLISALGTIQAGAQKPGMPVLRARHEKAQLYLASCFPMFSTQPLRLISDYSGVLHYDIYAFDLQDLLGSFTSPRVKSKDKGKQPGCGRPQGSWRASCRGRRAGRAGPGTSSRPSPGPSAAAAAGQRWTLPRSAPQLPVGFSSPHCCSHFLYLRKIPLHKDRGRGPPKP